MTTPTAPSRPAARWGLLAIALLLGVVLITVTARSYLQARALAGTITRGQAERFLRGLRERVGHDSSRRPPQRAGLQQLLDEHAEAIQALLDDHGEAGLCAVTVYAPDGRELLSVGDAQGNRAPMPAPGQLQAVGERLRLLAPPPPPPPPPQQGGPPPPPRQGGPPPGAPPAPDGWGPPPHPHPNRGANGGPPEPILVVLELVPLEAQHLLALARIDLTVGIITALVLMLAAAVFWRASLRAERDAVQLAERRHLASLGEMSAVLAHEIKNPLTALKGHAQLLAELFPQGERARRSADQVVEHALRLEDLIADLLAFARSGTIEVAAVSPAELLAQAAREVDADRIDVDVESAPDDWLLDAARMRQVLVNLLDNALQASTSDDRVELSAEVEGGRLLISVRDHGEGIDEDDPSAIFHPFHTQRARGTGLGLAVARRIVELHGGHIEADNQDDGGAMFRVSIPGDPGD